MNNKTNSKKMNVPHGILTEIAKRAKSTYQSVGATLGIYENTAIGVSAERQTKIKEVAVIVANEKKAELDSFIEAIEAV